MPVIDLAFDLQGTTISLDYGYALFGAISRIVPQMHGDRRIGVHPIRGVRLAPRRLTLVPQSKLRLRMPSEEIGTYLAIAGTRLELDGSSLHVGIPRVEPLKPSSSLISRLVTIGRLIEPSAFAVSVRNQMSALGVQGELGLLPNSDPARAGEPARRVIRIKERRIVGYAVCVSGLTAEESLIIQEKGLGSRRRMGCGLFVRKDGILPHE
jgi:CRISPR-associated protein Cas6